MNKICHIRHGIFALILCMSLCGCGSTGGTQETKTSAAEVQQTEAVPDDAVIIDYGDAESFEAALNEGKNLEGKVVRFTAVKLVPDSAFGYDIWAGEHLNFVSSRNPDVQAGDTVTVRVSTIESIIGSWIINYEKVDNAVISEDTITNSTNNKPAEKANDTNSDDTYEHNAYYDIVETSTYKNTIGDTIVIHKVLAKKDVMISSSLLVYGADGNVIGKGSDEITLTEGKYNFFRYYFESDITNVKMEANYKAEKDSYLTGERNAVDMVKYNKSGDDLYITFKQNVDKLDYFAKFKLLLYKGDKIVDTEDGYFSIYAENLSGKGSTDVAKIWVYGSDFDKVEYIFEP